MINVIIDFFSHLFELPYVLLLVLVISPALALFFWWRERSRQRLLAQFIEARLLSTLTVGISQQRRQIRYALLIAVATLLIVALARPYLGYDEELVEQNGLDVVVAVDTSKSMLAQDIVPDRLERAKLAALGLMQNAKSDRLGLVAFAGQAFLECPLTADDPAFEESVQALNVDSVSQGGTGIANAIDTAMTAFREKGHYNAIVLLTDGEDNVDESAALAAAKRAAGAGVKIFTIGIGSTAGDFIRVAGADGNSDFVRDAQGNVVKTHLNESLLREIAGTTGGFYLPLQGADTMDVLYDRGLAPLPKAQGVGRKIQHYHEQYYWPLALAIVLLLAEILVPERSEKRKSSFGPQIGKPQKVRQPTIAAVANPGEIPPTLNISATRLLILMAFLLPMAAAATPADALREYNSGNYTNALKDFSNLAETSTNDLRLVFNAGDAAYRMTNYDLAQGLFQQVTLSQDISLQQKALYNLGNTQFQMAKKATDLDGLIAGLEIAEKTYGHAVGLNTNDIDAAYNLKFTTSMVNSLKAFREALLRAKNEADLSVRRAEFHQAFEIMAPIQSKLQNTVAEKQFKDFVKRLKDVDDITTPHSQ
jgi:Ca-activated chloride channel family protein